MRRGLRRHCRGRTGNDISRAKDFPDAKGSETQTHPPRQRRYSENSLVHTQTALNLATNLPPSQGVERQSSPQKTQEGRPGAKYSPAAKGIETLPSAADRRNKPSACERLPRCEGD